MLWELALRGSRDELLPEIAGQAAYRISPGLNLRELGLSGALAGRGGTGCSATPANLHEMSQWPGFDRERAMRLLNALYLQAGLIVSRTHPAAHQRSWSGAAGCRS